MKSIFFAFRQFMKSIWGDLMLAACLFSPILMGIVFKIGIPLLEKFLCGYFDKAAILEPYYILFDLLLSLMTPLMLCFSGAMVILEELDDGTAKYLLVTPLGKTGYLFSRIGVINLLSIFYNIIIMFIFSISDISWYNIVISFVLNSIISVIVAMLVISFAKNKVEGMALIKLSGFMIFGFIVAFFIKNPLGYIVGVLPSFWIGKISSDDNLLFVIPCIIVSFIWITLLYKRFSNKILG